MKTVTKALSIVVFTFLLFITYNSYAATSIFRTHETPKMPQTSSWNPLETDSRYQTLLRLYKHAVKTGMDRIAENYRKELENYANAFYRSHPNTTYTQTTLSDGSVVYRSTYTSPPPAPTPPKGRMLPKDILKLRKRQQAEREQALKDRTAALASLFDNLKDELDNKKDELTQKMFDTIGKLLSQGENVTEAYNQALADYKTKFAAIEEKEHFLDGIENLSPRELIKKRDALAVEADTSGKYTLLLDYIKAKDKNKFLADKRIELNNQEAEGKDVTVLENLLYEIEYLGAGQLADKKAELFEQILNNPSDETLQWKLDILGQVFGVYDKFSESAGNPFGNGYFGRGYRQGSPLNVDSPWFPEYSNTGYPIMSYYYTPPGNNGISRGRSSAPITSISMQPLYDSR